MDLAAVAAALVQVAGELPRLAAVGWVLQLVKTILQL